MVFQAEERETVITSDDSCKEWEIYTMQGKIMTKMRKLGIEPYEVERDEENKIISACYKVGSSQVSFRNKTKKRELTEEERKIVAERFKKNLGR